MLKRLFLISSIGVLLSGCFMAPMALIGPITSGFSTASIIQSCITTGADYVVKTSTGKSIGEHAIDALTGSNEDILKQTYFPQKEEKFLKKENQ